MKPEELEKMPLQVERLFYDLQKRVMEDIVRRIRKTGGITSTADYQIEKLIMMGQSSEFIESEIKRLTQMTDAEIYQLYEDVIDKEYTQNKAIYEQVNANFIPYEDSPEMQAWVSAIVAQTRGEIKNITQSMGFALKYGGKTVFTPFAEYYQKYLDRACMDIITGTFSYNTVLRRVVKEMTASGIRTVDYASGHSNRIIVAARRAIMTGVNQLCGKINQMNAEKLGTDTYEVPWHAGARPSHWWGGMIFTMQELIDICGLGTGEGIGGWNCYHPYYAFIPGISVRQYTDEQLAELNAKEKIEREWHGKKYNTYAASQKQRQMETLMRKQRSDVKFLRDGKASRDEITIAQARYMKTLHEYQAFSKKMNLPGQMERVYMDGLGRIASGRMRIKLNDAAKSTRGYDKGLSSKGMKERNKAAYSITGKYTVRNSKWSGNVVFDEEKCRKERIAGRKLWSCDILLRKDCQDRTIIHEHLHARSGSYLNPLSIIQHKNMEEASVEFLAREICRAENIPFTPNKNHKVDYLYELNQKLNICDSNLDFAISLFAKSINTRYNWLEKKVEKLIDSREISAEERNSLAKIMKNLKGYK